MKQQKHVGLFLFWGEVHFLDIGQKMSSKLLFKEMMFKIEPHETNTQIHKMFVLFPAGWTKTQLHSY